jgi:IS1 family transposase
MNRLPFEKQSLVLTLLSEGNSIRSIARISGVDKKTISSLLLLAGEEAREVMNREMVNLKVSKLQVDEIWTFVGKKQKRLTELDSPELGDQYVFVALDADTKLVPAFRVGKRTGKLATSFMVELSTRIMTRFQLTTDSFTPYFEAVERVFGSEIDYGQIHKQYAEEPRGEKRYSPAQIVSVTKKILCGEPQRKYISTSYVERQNLTIRMQMRRFTRLTNAFSKSLRHLEAAMALHFFHYNFMRIHQTLRVTPAMEAKLTRRIWSWNDLLNNQIQSQAA